VSRRALVQSDDGDWYWRTYDAAKGATEGWIESGREATWLDAMLMVEAHIHWDCPGYCSVIDGCVVFSLPIMEWVDA
jgi:hypothetical protein